MRSIGLFLFASLLCTQFLSAQTMQEAQVALKKHKYDKAVEVLNGLLANSPDDAKLRSLRGRALTERATHKQQNGLRSQEDQESVFRDARMAVEDMTAAIEAGVGARGVSVEWRGRAYALQNQFAEAITDLSTAIEQRPKQASAYYHRGLVYRCMGDTESAVRDFHTSLQFKPEDALAFRERAMCQEDLGLDRQTMTFMSDGVVYMSCSLKGIKDPEKVRYAIADYERAIAVDADDCQSRRRLAELFAVTGNASGCIEQLSEICKRQPENAEVWQRMAEVRACHHQPEFRDGASAIEAAQKAISITGEPYHCQLMTLAYAYAESGDFEKAAETVEQAIATASDSKVATGPYCRIEYENKAELFRRKQPYRDEALQDFTSK